MRGVLVTDSVDIESTLSGSRMTHRVSRPTTGGPGLLVRSEQSQKGDITMQLAHTTLGQRVLFGAGQADMFVSDESSRLRRRRPMMFADSRHQLEAAHVLEADDPVHLWGDGIPHVSARRYGCTCSYPP